MYGPERWSEETYKELIAEGVRGDPLLARLGISREQQEAFEQGEGEVVYVVKSDSKPKRPRIDRIRIEAPEEIVEDVAKVKDDKKTVKKLAKKLYGEEKWDSISEKYDKAVSAGMSGNNAGTQELTLNYFIPKLSQRNPSKNVPQAMLC